MVDSSLNPLDPHLLRLCSLLNIRRLTCAKLLPTGSPDILSPDVGLAISVTRAFPNLVTLMYWRLSDPSLPDLECIFAHPTLREFILFCRDLPSGLRLTKVSSIHRLTVVARHASLRTLACMIAAPVELHSLDVDIQYYEFEDDERLHLFDQARQTLERHSSSLEKLEFWNQFMPYGQMDDICFFDSDSPQWHRLRVLGLCVETSVRLGETSHDQLRSLQSLILFDCSWMDVTPLCRALDSGGFPSLRRMELGCRSCPDESRRHLLGSACARRDIEIYFDRW